MEPKAPEQKDEQPKELSEMVDEGLENVATFWADDQHWPSRLEEPETIDKNAADTPLDPIMEALTIDPFEHPQKNTPEE